VEFEREKEELRDSIERFEESKRELLKGVKDRREYLREEIERVEKFNNGITEQVDKVESRVDDIRGQIEDCRSSEERIEREIKLFEDNIIRETNICRDIDEKFNKIAENCEVEWFRNKWMTHPYKDKVKELKYWTS
jgi:chromosome segregation ATPase